MDHEVPDVGNPREGVGEDEDRALLIENGIGEQQQRPDQAQPPERRRHRHLFLLLRGIPLDDEARGEDEVAGPAHDLPCVPFDAEKVSVVPEPVHEAVGLTAPVRNRKREVPGQRGHAQRASTTALDTRLHPRNTTCLIGIRALHRQNPWPGPAPGRLGCRTAMTRSGWDRQSERCKCAESNGQPAKGRRFSGL